MRLLIISLSILWCWGAKAQTQDSKKLFGPTATGLNSKPVVAQPKPLVQPKAVPSAPVAPAPQTPVPPPAPPAAVTPPSSVPITQEGEKPSDLLAGVIEDYNYNPDGKRDPFSPFDSEERVGGNSAGPMFPLQKYDLDQLKLVGVIWDVSQPKAMITDPAGKGYVIKLNDRLGRSNGYVAKIREGEIVIIESFKSPEGKTSYQTRILKLGGE